MVRIVPISFLATVLAGMASADTLEAPAVVISGDILELRGQEVRLLGIDAPERNQTCWDAAGQAWPCGERARLALSAKINDAVVACNGIRRDRERRLIAVCRYGDVNLNAWMVETGMALAYRNHSLAYVADEEQAREAARGLWAGVFEPPWVWRAKHVLDSRE